MKTLVTLMILSLSATFSYGAEQIKVLIIDGVNNHNWEMTTKATMATLEKTGRFDVDVSTSPSDEDSPQSEWDAWDPKFSDYDVVLSNINTDSRTLWSEKTKEGFLKFVRDGGGFVSVHAADNSNGDWDEYNEIIGLGGWGDREAGKSGYLYRLIDGKWQADSPNEGYSGEHASQREFGVIHDKPDHPILKGLPTEWLHGKDELYSALRGPAKNIEVLAHSHSKLTEVEEPTIFLVKYGKGTTLHLPMGHSNRDGSSLHCVGFQTVLARGTEFIATGEVTIGIPEGFPTKDKSSIISPDKVKW